MQIFVIRHGETQSNREEIFRGRKDVPLNDIGRKQAEMVGAHFARMNVGRIVSSPLTRAFETAQAIGRATGVAVESTEALTDMGFGIWEGLPLREVEARYPRDLSTWRESPQDLRVEGGESLDQVRERMSKGMASLASDRGRQIVCVVTHRVVCKLMVLHYLNIGSSHFWDMRFDPCSVTLIEKAGKKAVLAFSNDTCHLRESGTYRDF